MSSLTQSPAWNALAAHYETTKDATMRDLFAHNQKRFETFSRTFDEILLDFSKNRITSETFGLLIDLAKQAQVEKMRDAMFNGEKINITEDRAVLHIALRNRANRPIVVDGEDVMPFVNTVLAQMEAFCAKVRGGEWKGYSGKAITDIVNIGIGGSDLGPVMVTEALKLYGSPHLRVKFVSTIDGTHIAEALKVCNP